jgi:hypothetical protein
MSYHQFTVSRKRPRTRSNIAVTFLTTAFIITSENVVGAVFLPTWASPTGGESHHLSNEYKNGSDVIEPINIHTTIDDNHQHNVVRRPRRDDNNFSNNKEVGADDNVGKETSKRLSVNEREATGTDTSGYASSQSSVYRKSAYERSRMSTSKVIGDDKWQLNSFVPPEQAVYDQREHDRFLTWCRDTLGIFSLLEIRVFEYEDFTTDDMLVDLEEDLIDLSNDHRGSKEKQKVPIRGLAAIQDIEKGEVIIEIPLKALWSLGTTIDSDPVLGGNVMGPQARTKYGWDTALENDNKTVLDNKQSNSTETQFFEMPLLAVALLYHVQLKEFSSYAPYINILKATPIDSMPFLWTAKRLKESPIATEGVRAVAKSIRQEMRDMYESVVEVLIENHPGVFGKDTARRNNQEWMYSYEKFQWAFAIVNSRHWQLPIEDVDVLSRGLQAKADNPMKMSNFEPGSPMNAVVDEQLPPASMPTQHWVQEHGDVDDELPISDQSVRLASHKSLNFGSGIIHSFLAPVADLLNFGPPCTRGR